MKCVNAITRATFYSTAYIIISSVYILPNIDKSNYELYTNFVDEIYSYYLGSNVIMIGNFNLPNILWSHNLQEIIIISHFCIANSTESSIINDLSYLHYF